MLPTFSHSVGDTIKALTFETPRESGVQTEVVLFTGGHHLTVSEVAIHCHFPHVLPFPLLGFSVSYGVILIILSLQNRKLNPEKESDFKVNN